LKYTTELITFLIRYLQGDLHPCEGVSMSPTPVIPEKKVLKSPVSVPHPVLPSFQDRILSGANIALTFQIRASTLFYWV